MPPPRIRILATATGLATMLAAGVLMATTASAAAGCRVDYTITNQWQNGFGANVTVTNLGDPIDGWTVRWSYGTGQAVTQAWNATVTQSGSQVTAADAGFNRGIATNAAVSFGFNGSWTGTNPAPTSFTLNGTTCTGAVNPTSSSPAPSGPSPSSPAPSSPAPSGPAPSGPAAAGRLMENLGRGVVAVRASSTGVLVSWRLLGLDPAGIGFNVYRSTGGAAEVKINGSVLTGGTNFTDTTANLAQTNAYRVRPIVNGVEQAPSAPFTLKAGNAVEPVVRVPLRAGGAVKFVWTGDLDGDGEYDYVIDRQTSPQSIEAYRGNGQFLWSANLGPNSTNQDNIEGGSSVIDVGHNDGVTVYDLDSDGRAEVALRIANGVRFGNGTTFTNADDNRQFIAILDGMTGAPRATAPVPTDYLADGPLMARFGVGHLDGTSPSLVAYMKNRIGDGGFNLMFTAWRFTGSSLTMQWKFLRGNQNLPDGHNTRVIDVDGDGRDEIAEIGFVLNGDGRLRYSLAAQGVVHGDRFHIAKMDPNRAGLQGYAVQQDNASGLREYYYDASTGRILWKHTEPGVGDVGRGMAGDIDARYPGYEVWSFSGLYNGPANRLAEPDTGLAPAACPVSSRPGTSAPSRRHRAAPRSPATFSGTGVKRSSTPTPRSTS
jgi:rhamnogalacturonan endolyase